MNKKSAEDVVLPRNFEYRDIQFDISSHYVFLTNLRRLHQVNLQKHRVLSTLANLFILHDAVFRR